MKKLIPLILALLLALPLAACSGSNYEAAVTVAGASEDGSSELVAEKDLRGDPDFGSVGYQLDMPEAGEEIAVITMETGEVIKLRFFPEAAPKTVYNFKRHAMEGYYDGLTFHRIIDGFMIQGGDPSHDGTGGSDETIKGEFSQNGVENNISHRRGVISMARSSEMDSASSQFFIVQADSTYLDGQYAAFGHVTSGMEIVDQICEEANPTDDNGTIPYEEQPVIESIVITD